MGVVDVTPLSRSIVGFGRRGAGTAIVNGDSSWLEGSAQVPIEDAAK